MALFLSLLILCFFIFLFGLYVVSREDFVFIRKNVGLEDIFNAAFLSSIIGILSARLFYVLFNPNPAYFNPLVLLLFPYFPGLSLYGGIIGGTMAAWYIAKRKKYSPGRLLDFLSIGMLSAFPVGYLMLYFISEEKNVLQTIIPALFYFVLAVFYGKVLLPSLQRGQIKDGTLGFLFLMNFSLMSFLLQVIQSAINQKLQFRLEELLLIIIFVFSFFSYATREYQGRQPKKSIT